MIDTYSEEWRRITEARWVLRECRDTKRYLDGVLKARGQAGYDTLVTDIQRVRFYNDKFTKRVAAELIQQMKAEDEETRLDLAGDRGHRPSNERRASAG